MAKDSPKSGGIGFVGLLTIVFITLKLVRFEGNPVSDWSWWWVLSPILISTGLIIVALLIGFVILVVKELRR